MNITAATALLPADHATATLDAARDAATAPHGAARHGAVARWRGCSQCGLVAELPEMRAGMVAECPRCHFALRRIHNSTFTFPLACGVAGVMFYVFGLLSPFLEITAYGRFQLAHLTTGPWQLNLQDYPAVGLLVLAVSVVFPGVKLGLMLFTLVGLELQLSPRLLKPAFRWHRKIGPWAMVDVYLLGFLVAYTRLAAMAAVRLDTALYALIGLLVSLAAADAGLDTEMVWQRLDQAAGESGEAITATTPVVTCLDCLELNAAPAGQPCRRCHAILQDRKPSSISRSWALVIAAACLYIPANVYPVMLITKLTVTQPFTIAGGIVELAQYGLWPLALLVFFASITIPVLKLLILGYMLVQTQRGSASHLLGRARAFRLIEFIGRWSMIDVFMVSILVALVRFGQFANIRADVGATCFAGVVVLTMFAVDCFDPRLMWDALPPGELYSPAGGEPGEW